VYSDLNACIRDLSAILERKRTAHPSSTDDGDGDGDQPMTMHRLQVNVPLSVLQGGQQAATRRRLRDEVFRSIRQVCELLRAINNNTSTSSLSDSDSDSDGFSGSSIYLGMCLQHLLLLIVYMYACVYHMCIILYACELLFAIASHHIISLHCSVSTRHRIPGRTEAVPLSRSFHHSIITLIIFIIPAAATASVPHRGWSHCLEQ
jgi:hypothetical protein